MVQCCHLTENLFDILRTGKRTVTPELMDVVLQALDNVNTQFNIVSAREELPPVDPALIASLERLVSCADLNEAASQAPSVTAPMIEQKQELPVQVSASPQRDITDMEFEQLLDAISDKPASAAPVSKAPESNTMPPDDISDDEFEALLDQLHGRGKAPSASLAIETPKKPVSPAVSSSTTSSSTNASSEEISDDEFESLLDQLHGKGKGPTKTNATLSAVKAEPPAAASQPPKAMPASAPAKSEATKAEPSKIESSKNEAIKTEPVKTPAQAPVAADKDQGIETTVRVDTQRLDDIMNMVGELVLVRNRLMRLGNASANEPLIKAVANLDVVTADLQTSVMKTRMQPIKKVFGRFPRVVRDLARNLKKEINLELVGEETDLDKNLVEALADPLVHLVRNSVDHGVELPEARVANGKARTGLVILSAQQEGDHILLIISDDGAGMDPNKLRRVAVEKGLYDEDSAARLTDVEAFNLIFAPGFSTKKEISDVSGRGVGMDVVKTKINQLNGTVEIQSVLGKGTRFIIKVPLTLAIMPTLMIMVGKQTFALPLASVNEIFHMNLSKSHVVDGQDCIAIRDQAIPLFYMKEWLVKDGFSEPRQKLAHVVIVTVGSRRVGFVVDQLIGQEEVVIKPLGKMLQGTPGMAGATITGDGTIALILDIPSLLRRYARGNFSWGHT
jgi:two-component system, chemotaxis family, sensor kinase CheA